MKELLKALDIIGPHVTLTIEKKRYFKSVEGGVLTIVFAFLSILAFIGFGRDIVDKKIPQVNFNQQPDTNATLNITEETIIFAIVDQITLTELPDFTRKLFPYFHWIEVRGNNLATIYHPVPAVKCDVVILNKYRSQLIVPDYNYYCLPKGTHLQVKGNELQSQYNYLRLNVDICKNTTEVSNCLADDYIRSSIGRLKMHYLITDAYMDSYNYTEPGVVSTFVNFPISNINTFSRQVIYYKSVEYNTDIGWILEETQVKTYKALYRVDQLFIPIINTTTLFSHLFANSFYKDVYDRQYIKIQGVFAYIGGFISLSLQIMTLVTHFIVDPDKLKIFSDNLIGNSSETANSSMNPNNNQIFNIKKNALSREIINRERNLHDVMFNQQPYNYIDRIEEYADNIQGKIYLKVIIDFLVFTAKKSEGNFSNELGINKYKLLQKLPFCMKVLRLCLPHCKTEQRKKIKIMNEWRDIFNEKFSFENFTSHLRKFEVFQKVMLEDYQINMIELIPYSDWGNKLNKEKAIEEMNRNKYSPVNAKLLNLLS
jgi:hypothetical protein